MRMIRFCLIVCVGCILSKGVYAQTDSIVSCFEKIRTATGDSMRLHYAGDIENFLRQIPFGTYGDQKPVKYLCYKPDGAGRVEMFSWAVPLGGGQVFYNLFHIREGDHWYRMSSLDQEGDIGRGWLFYDWLAFEWKGEACYLLLGWNRTRQTNQKIILVVKLGDDGKIHPGPACIRKDGDWLASLEFEYAVDGSMMLKQEQQGKRIIFDHLAPNDPKYKGYYMLYGADGSYDALILEADGWVYVTNYQK